MKKYGIFFSYPHAKALQDELEYGLLNLIQNAAQQTDTRFVIAAPDENLRLLQASLSIDISTAPNIEFLYFKNKKGLKNILFKNLKHMFAGIQSVSVWVKRLSLFTLIFLIRKMVSCKHFYQITTVSIFGVLISPFLFVAISLSLATTVSLLLLKQSYRLFLSRFKGYVSNLLHIKNSYWRSSRETALLKKIIRQRPDVHLWIINSTSFINLQHIKAKIVLHVSEVLYYYGLIHISLGKNYPTIRWSLINQKLESAPYFITNNEKIKQSLLIEQYHYPENKISLIPPPVPNYQQYITVSGFMDNEVASLTLCKNIVISMINRNVNLYPPGFYVGTNISFILCVNQVPYSPNLLSLLKAYHLLMETQGITKKLIIHLDPNLHPEAYSFMREQAMFQHTIWIKDMSKQELAACYKIANLIIEPSLDFISLNAAILQALALNTPILLSKNSESEILFQQFDTNFMSLFNPSSFEDIAEKISFALNNKEKLVELQKNLKEALSCTTGQDNLSMYLGVLEGIS